MSHPLGVPRQHHIPPELLDPARRCSDAMNTAMHTGLDGYVAIRLSDGHSDGKVYESWADANRFQLHPDQCMYLQVQRRPMPLPEAASLLTMFRRMYETGFRPVNPELMRGQNRG